MQYKLVVGVTMLLGVIAITGAGCANTNQTKNSADQSANMIKKEDAMTEVQKKTAMMEKEKMESEQVAMEKQKMEDKEKAAMMEKEKTMTPEEKMMAEKEAAMEKEKMMTANTVGMYKDYSPAALAEATKNDGKAVLFFWASWCPNCKEANADFLDHTSQIPKNVTVLKTNYDTEKELKTKYGVTYQHTFIQVDANGNQISRWNGGGIAELISNLK